MSISHFTRTTSILSLLLAAGCASIVSGGPKTIPITSVPDDAVCEIVDVRSGASILKTKTPYTATLANDAGFFRNARYRVKISKDGYIPREVPLEAGVNGWYFGNVVFGGLLGILIVDPATGAMWKIHQDSIAVHLYPDSPEGRRTMDEEQSADQARITHEAEPKIRMGL